MAIQGYSVKAGKNVDMIDPVISKTKKGGFIAKGKCPETGITVCRIMSKEKAEKAIADGEAKKGY